MRVKHTLALALCSLLCLADPARTEPTSDPPASAAPAAPTEPAHCLGHKILMYLPNRLLDLVDIFRCRLRAGPGLAADARVTIYAANFIGQYDAVYAGLPGPRRAPVLPLPVGREALKGLLVMGVDATDATPYPPHYSDSEMTLGVHALLVGLDLGFDPVELGDFLTGWVMIDIAGDDL